MTALLIDELTSTLSQEITFSGEARRRTIVGIRPYIYMHNAPTGTFTLSFKSGATTLASETFTSATIKSDLNTTNNYAWLAKALTFDDFQVDGGTYTIELSSSSYTFSESSYLGWIRRHENIYVTSSPTVLDEHPKTLEVFEKMRRIYT